MNDDDLPDHVRPMAKLGRAQFGGVLVVAPGLLLMALGAPLGVTFSYLVVMVVVLAATAIRLPDRPRGMTP